MPCAADQRQHARRERGRQVQGALASSNHKVHAHASLPLPLAQVNLMPNPTNQVNLMLTFEDRESFHLRKTFNGNGGFRQAYLHVGDGTGQK